MDWKRLPLSACCPLATILVVTLRFSLILFIISALPTRLLSSVYSVPASFSSKYLPRFLLFVLNANVLAGFLTICWYKTSVLLGWSTTNGLIKTRYWGTVCKLSKQTGFRPLSTDSPNWFHLGTIHENQTRIGTIPSIKISLENQGYHYRNKVGAIGIGGRYGGLDIRHPYKYIINTTYISRI